MNTGARRTPATAARPGAALAAAAIAGLLAASLHAPPRMPKRFGVVEPGRLFRSGDVTPEQLETLRREAGLGRVISLLDPTHPRSVAERAAARELGIDWQNIPLTGDGASRPEDRDRLRALLLDPAAPPTLVHCAAGANRTGLAIGIYRLHHGWTLPQVLNEMRRFGFEDREHHENLRSALALEADMVPRLGKSVGAVR